MEKLTDREVREKLVSRGVQSLSDRELLSIILGEGSAGYSAVETAGRILDAYDGSLPAMARADMTRLRMTEGIGVKRAAVLTAVFELAGRLHRQEAAAPASIRTKDDVTALFAPLLARLPHEEMWALYLSSANGVIEKMRVSQGGVTALVVDYKLIVKRAVEVLASSSSSSTTTLRAWPHRVPKTYPSPNASATRQHSSISASLTISSSPTVLHTASGNTD